MGDRDPITPRVQVQSAPRRWGRGHFRLLCLDGNDSCGRREFGGPVTHTTAGSQILPPPEGPGFLLPTGGVRAPFQGNPAGKGGQEGQCQVLGPAGELVA